MTTTVLVTGATGTVGRHVVRQLTCMPSVAVRAASRMANNMPPGDTAAITHVEFDFDKPETYARALAGAKSVFLLQVTAPSAEQHTAALAHAAREAGVEQIVRLSALGADPAAPILIGRWHGAADVALAQSGVAATILRPSTFMQNFIHHYLPDPNGEIRLAVGAGAMSFIDVEDVAGIAARALTTPDHRGKTYDLTGPVALTMTEAALQLTHVVGRPFHFVDVPESVVRESMANAGLAPVFVNAIVELYGAYKAGYAARVTTTVKAILGGQARTFADFARSNVACWR